MTCCKLCSKIYTNEEAEKWRESEVDWLADPSCILYTDTNKIKIWIGQEDGCYDTQATINYCPLCGRKLITD